MILSLRLHLWLAAVLACLTVALGQTHPGSGVEVIPVFGPNTRILFQGDSITDGNRGRGEDPNHILGHGYAFIIAAKYGAAFPERNLMFLNRGISGNKVTDLAERWQKDTLDLKPDILSILIGVNDHGANLPLDRYEQVYDKLLADVRAANPNIRLVLGEPFSLPVGSKKTDWQQWNVGMKQRQEIVARLAQKHHAALVRFQGAFDAACQRAPTEHWIWDGIHPTYSGHQIMADEWVRTVREFWPARL
jgi:lysophospholipase L1-like esterase